MYKKNLYEFVFYFITLSKVTKIPLHAVTNNLNENINDSLLHNDVDWSSSKPELHNDVNESCDGIYGVRQINFIMRLIGTIGWLMMTSPCLN